MSVFVWVVLHRLFHESVHVFWIVFFSHAMQATNGFTPNFSLQPKFSFVIEAARNLIDNKDEYT